MVTFFVLGQCLCLCIYVCVCVRGIVVWGTEQRPLLCRSFRCDFTPACYKDREKDRRHTTPHVFRFCLKGTICKNCLFKYIKKIKIKKKHLHSVIYFVQLCTCIILNDSEKFTILKSACPLSLVACQWLSMSTPTAIVTMATYALTA